MTTTPDARRRLFRLVIVDGEVVIVSPSGATWVLPSTSDDLLCDAVREARHRQPGPAPVTMATRVHDAPVATDQRLTSRRRDARTAAALMVLKDQLDPVIAELLAGELDEDDRRGLARVFATLAGELDPHTTR